MQVRPFVSASDFVAKVPGKTVNRKCIKVLALSGAFDIAFKDEPISRMEMYGRLMTFKEAKTDVLQEISYENTLFTNKKKLEYEKQILSVYLSGHPLDEISEPIAWDGFNYREKIKGKCIINSIREILTKKNKDKMAFLELEFMEKTIDSVAFPDLYNSVITMRKEDHLLNELLKVNMVVDIVGEWQYDAQRDSDSFILSSIKIPIKHNKELLIKK